MADTGNGGRVQAKKGNHVMAESSQSSTGSGRKRTTKTEPLTPDQALEILQQAVRECLQAGIKAGVSHLNHAGVQNTIIVLEGVDFVDGNFVLANAGK